MNASTNVTHTEIHESGMEKVWRAARRAPFLEAILGIGTVVLSIVGLAHVLPGDLASVATIAIGLALLFEGSSIAAESRELLARTYEAKAEMAGAVTAEFLSGLTGIILGIMALVNIETQTLVPVALIVFGATYLLGAGAKQFAPRPAAGSAEEANWQMFREAASVVSGGQVLIGLASLVLGIIALLSANPLVLSLCGFLLLGVSVLLSSSAIGAKLMSTMRR